MNFRKQLNLLLNNHIINEIINNDLNQDTYERKRNEIEVKIDYFCSIFLPTSSYITKFGIITIISSLIIRIIFDMVYGLIQIQMKLTFINDLFGLYYFLTIILILPYIFYYRKLIIKRFYRKKIIYVDNKKSLEKYFKVFYKVLRDIEKFNILISHKKGGRN